MALADFAEKELSRYFRFLDDLRGSGETNMFGAGPFIQSEFGLTRSDAREVVMEWMRTFDPDVTPAIRAKGAITKAA